MRKKTLFEAIATLVGTVIGAGILGIPYVVAKAGFLTGLLSIVIIGLVILTMNLYFGEVVLRTKGNHQLTGYAQKYLGKNGKRLMTFTMIVGVYGALIAYLIGEGQALSAIFTGPPLIYSLLFFIFVSTLIYKGLKLIKSYELWMSSIVIVIIFLICLISLSKLDLSNLATLNLSNILLPYGVVLFAFLGAAAIPEIKEELSHNRKQIKKAIIIGSLIPLVVYALFAFFVVASTGLNTTEIATIGLGILLGKKMVIFGNLFAIFAMTTSFLTLGLALKQMYDYDYKLNEKLSWALTCFIPLILFLLGIKSFIKTIGYVGAFAGGIEGILIVLMAWKAQTLGDKKPEYKIVKGKILGYIIMLIFIIGIIYQLTTI